MQESVFTLPHAECPNPHHWHTDDGDSTEQEVSVIVGGLIRGLQPEYVVETGTAFGQTTVAIGTALRNNGHGRLVSLEVDPERVTHSRQRCKNLPMVSILEQSSLDWIPQAPIDFMWLDSLPHLRGPELRRLLPHASNRCVIGIHDTTTHRDPLKGELAAMAEEGLIVPPLYLPTPRGVGFTRVAPK